MYYESLHWGAQVCTSNFTSDISGEKFKVVQFCSNYDLTSQKTDSIDLLDNIVVRKYLF